MKPEIIQLYNKTKGGVDTWDQLCHIFCIRKNYMLADENVLCDARKVWRKCIDSFHKYKSIVEKLIQV
jgi:hypothetical protein